jgi:squalene-associated FAD-dependent desaturase
MTEAARAVVLGGGVAGLAAAFGLADRGRRVTLLESRAWLGGRAFSSLDRESGVRLDNGAHVMLGCYRATRALLRRLGTEQHFRQDRALAIAYRERGGRALRLALGRAPVPLALPWALLRLGIPFGARLRALRGLLGALRRAPADCSLADWLARRGQLGQPAGFLWRPMCRAMMNVDPEHAAAADFLAAVREAFVGRAARAALWTPSKTWGELLGDPAPGALAAAGVELRLGARAAAIEVAHDRVRAIVLGGGERVPIGERDLVVSALPWFALRAVLRGPPAALREIGEIGELDASPIVSANVTLDAAAAPLPDEGPLTALVDGEPFHFVLRTPGGDARRFVLLSGGDRSFDGQPVDAIAARALRQLAAFYPAASFAGASVRIRKEQRATFVAAPGSARARPRPGRLAHGPANLLVCGDWTATGLPSTLEGAVRSAESMLAQVVGERR